MSRGGRKNGQGRKAFATTRWSLVVAAADSDHPDYVAALSQLCGDYWYPVYAFLRRRGFAPDRAQDLTQGFFTELLEKRTLRAVRRERGRFRSFLLAALKFHLSHERERAGARKRGGDQALIRLDADTAESRYRLEPVEPRTPENLFERRWALLLLERTLDRLRDELKRSADTRRSLRLVGYLTGDSSATYREAAVELGMSESALKVAVHRLRGRFRALLRAEVLQTVADPDKVDAELSHLLAAVGEP